jgi:cobyrinic acid a,c-diamide synthase
MIAAGESAPVLGWVARQKGAEVGSRHLGLVMAHESNAMGTFGRIIEESCDLDAILAAARDSPPIAVPRFRARVTSRTAVIGVARDEAFCFYYQDNLDRLVRAGAGIRFFSPIRDALPEVDGLYLGGGYPELHAAALEAAPCRQQIRVAAAGGLPIYAECGGLLYLCESVRQDREFRMAGVLPARAEMTDRIQGLGYVSGVYAGKRGFWPGTGPVRGHEFHYSRVECSRDARFAIRLDRGTGISDGRDGLFSENALGTYTHAYFTDRFARRFVAVAAAVRSA